MRRVAWNLAVLAGAGVLTLALFSGLCGAITQLSLGEHRAAITYAVRSILLVVYVPVGLLAPVTSHLALTHRLLGEDIAPPPAIAAMPDNATWRFRYGKLLADDTPKALAARAPSGRLDDVFRQITTAPTSKVA